jgi:hypothetical protein
MLSKLFILSVLSLSLAMMSVANAASKDQKSVVKKIENVNEDKAQAKVLRMPASDVCRPFFYAVFDLQQAVSLNLLWDNEQGVVVDCLMQALRGTLDITHQKDRNAFNRVVAALLRLIENKTSGGMDVVKKIQSKSDISIISALSLGARNENRETRLNSTGLLTNIVANNSVCVVMDHLADPALLRSEYGLAGRVNLLAAVAVVAPWAQKSNYNNMMKLVKFVESQKDQVTVNLDDAEIIRNLKDRLAYQNTLKNPNKKSDKPEMQECRSMKIQWADTSDFSLKY